MKYKSPFLFVVGGGILGFVFHLIWHFRLGIELLSVAPHIIQGFIYIIIGMAIGLLGWYLLYRKL